MVGMVGRIVQGQCDHWAHALAWFMKWRNAKRRWALLVRNTHPARRHFQGDKQRQDTCSHIPVIAAAQRAASAQRG